MLHLHQLARKLFLLLSPLSIHPFMNCYGRGVCSRCFMNSERSTPVQMIHSVLSKSSSGDVREQVCVALLLWRWICNFSWISWFSFSIYVKRKPVAWYFLAVFQCVANGSIRKKEFRSRRKYFFSFQTVSLWRSCSKDGWINVSGYLTLIKFYESWEIIEFYRSISNKVLN